MKEIIKNKKLKLQYIPGNGAWTYHLVIPDTKDIDGSWGALKVSGLIDDYELKEMNLAPRTDADKMISINGDIRKEIGKSGGDTVNVTLFLHTNEKIDNKADVLKCFEDADVLKSFKALSKEEQDEKIDDIILQKTEAKQIEKINHYVNQLFN